MSTVGRKQLIITYNNLTTSIYLEVTEKTAIKKDPYIQASMTKTEYEVDDKLDLSELTVTYYDADGKSERVTDYTTNVDEIDMKTPGTKELVITYNRLTTTIELIVKEKSEPDDKTKASAPTADPGIGDNSARHQSDFVYHYTGSTDLLYHRRYGSQHHQQALHKPHHC